MNGPEHHTERYDSSLANVSSGCVPPRVGVGGSRHLHVNCRKVERKSLSMASPESPSSHGLHPLTEAIYPHYLGPATKGMDDCRVYTGASRGPCRAHGLLHTMEACRAACLREGGRVFLNIAIRVELDRRRAAGQLNSMFANRLQIARKSVIETGRS